MYSHSHSQAARIIANAEEFEKSLIRYRTSVSGRCTIHYNTDTITDVLQTAEVQFTPRRKRRICQTDHRSVSVSVSEYVRESVRVKFIKKYNTIHAQS